MKKIAIMLVALLSLSFLSFTASAGHYVVKCYKPCYKCKKVCKRYWVRSYRDGYHHRYYHHHYRR